MLYVVRKEGKWPKFVSFVCCVSPFAIQLSLPNRAITKYYNAVWHHRILLLSIFNFPKKCLVEYENSFQLCKKSKRMSIMMLLQPLFKPTKICLFSLYLIYKCLEIQIWLIIRFLDTHTIRHKNTQILVRLNKGHCNIVALILLLFLQSWNLYSFST